MHSLTTLEAASCQSLISPDRSPRGRDRHSAAITAALLSNINNHTTVQRTICDIHWHYNIALLKLCFD